MAHYAQVELTLLASCTRRIKNHQLEIDQYPRHFVSDNEYLSSDLIFIENSIRKKRVSSQVRKEE